MPVAPHWCSTHLAREASSNMAGLKLAQCCGFACILAIANKPLIKLFNIIERNIKEAILCSINSVIKVIVNKVMLSSY